MGVIKVILCGVSKYTRYFPLSFCENDIRALKSALQSGICVEDKNITVVTPDGVITRTDFIKNLRLFCDNADADDILLIYFSGHGASVSGKHYILVTDSINEQTNIDMNDFLQIVNNSKAKSKVIILDCCRADSGLLENTIAFDAEASVEKIYGSGCAVFVSCKSGESSYPYYNGKISAFTQFLCDALMDKRLKKDGYLYFNDFVNLVEIYAKVWNRKNPDKIQTPILRSNIFGSLAFPSAAKKTDLTKHIEDGQDAILRFLDFDIYNIEFSVKQHTKDNRLKAYTVKVVSKITLDDGNLQSFIGSVVDTVKNININPTNWKQEMVASEPVGIIWICIGNDLLDIKDGRFLYNVIWASQEREYWLHKPSGDTKVFTDFSVKKNGLYDYLKQQRLYHILSDDELINKWTKAIDIIISSVEEFLAMYRDYTLGSIDIDLLKNNAKSIYQSLSSLFDETDNMPFTLPNSEIESFDIASKNLCGTAQSLLAIYALPSNRAEQNAQDCFSIEQKNYQTELRQWVDIKKEYE